MIITTKQLSDIEATIGHSCEAWVMRGGYPGNIVIRVWGVRPDRQTVYYDEEFTRAECLNSDSHSILDRFKHNAKRCFDTHFSDSKTDQSLTCSMNKCQI